MISKLNGELVVLTGVIQKHIRRYPLSSFVLISYLLSWTTLYPSYQILLRNDGFHPLALIGLIGAYGPSITAVLVQRIEDKAGLQQLFRSLIRIRVSSSVYLMVILLPISFYIFATLIATWSGGSSPQLDLADGLKGIFIWVLLALPFGPMGEELGWRGYLLPKLIKRHGVFISTIIVGIIWGFWHLASFTFPGAAIPDFLPVKAGSILLFILNTVLLSFLYTAVFLKSGGSTFMAILLHAFLNAASNVATDFLGEICNSDLLLTAYILNMVFVGVTGWLLWPKKK